MTGGPMATATHPNLVQRDRLKPKQPEGWTRTDTTFVLMLLAALMFCMGLMKFATL
jgi:hypothetical protein